MPFSQEQRLREWRNYLEKQPTRDLVRRREIFKAWMVDPVHTYGTGPEAQADLDYDQLRLVAIDAEIEKRTPQP